MSTRDDEIVKKMQDSIRRKHQHTDDDDDGIVTLTDGSEVKIQYAEDK